MKTKTPARFEHHFEGPLAHIEWEGAPPLRVPLHVSERGREFAARRWKTRQGGAQARMVKGGGFLAFDYRADGYFHWRGHVGEMISPTLEVVADWDVTGWEVIWPGETNAVAITAETTLRLVSRLTDAPGESTPRARWFFFRPTGTARPGWLLSFPGPMTASAVELSIAKGRLTVTLLDYDNLSEKGRFGGPYLAPAVPNLVEAVQLHTLLTGKEGYVRHNDRPRRWWSSPTAYATNDFLASLADLPGDAARDRVLRLLDKVADAAGALPNGDSDDAENGSTPRHPRAILALDTNWCDAVGDWNPRCAPLFDGFREWCAFRDALHAAGHRVLLAFSPFELAANSRRLAESPWHLLRDHDDLEVQTSGGAYFLDYSGPETRELLDDLVEFLIGRGEESLGADGLVLEPLLGPGNREVAWRDPTWSGGERFWSRTLLHLAERARTVRPDAILEVAGNDAILCRTGHRARRYPVFAARNAGTALRGVTNGAAAPASDGMKPIRLPSADAMVPGTLHVEIAASLDGLRDAAAPAGVVLGKGGADE